jgi:uncharacterized protein YjbI with pentapeptide repeats
MPEDRKDEALILKTKLETRILAQQLTPSYRRNERVKTLISASGLIVALATVVGGLLSVGGWLIEQTKDRQIRSEERLDRGLNLLADDSPSKRLAGVYSLRSFLDHKDSTQNTQVLLALAGRLAIDDSPTVRIAMQSAIQDIDSKQMDASTLNSGLKSLIETSRSLIAEGHFWRDDFKVAYAPNIDPKTDVKLRGTAQAMVALLRKGARSDDMTGIYLGRSDLSGIDLSRVSFDDSILSFSDFSNATLRGTSFNGTNLEGTRFISADLRDSKFILSGKNLGVTRWDYVELQLARVDKGQVSVSMPDFSCSNLENADFSGASLFELVSNAVSINGFEDWGPIFWRANLKDANMRTAQFFGLATGHDPQFPFGDHGTTSLNGLSPHNSKDVRAQPMIPTLYRVNPNAPLGKSASDFSSSLSQLSTNFGDSNWQEAKLPKGLQTWLEQQSHAKFVSVESLTQPCVPRRL